MLHEDTRTGGFGAEIAATIAEEAFEDLDAPVKRIAAPDTPVPFSPPLEKAFIPQVEDVVAGTAESSRSTRRSRWPRNRDRGRHAADGRLRLGGDDHEVAEAGGRAVERDEPLLEISTDKVDTEVPSPGEGVVAKILVQEGETVEVGTVLAVIAPEGAEVPAAPRRREAPPEPATQEAADASRRPRARRRSRRHRRQRRHLRRRPLGARGRDSASTATAARSSRRSSRGSPPSTASTRARCRAPAAAAA